jgi:hypothetical protein
LKNCGRCGITSSVKKILIALLCIASVGLSAQNRPVTQPSDPGINLDKTLVLYGELSGRTVLRHPSLWRGNTFVFTSTATNHAEIIQNIEVAFAENEIMVVTDGEKFVLIGSKSRQAELVPGATNIIATTTRIHPKGSMYFVNAPVASVLAIYAELMGKKLDQSNQLPATTDVTLLQASALTKEECLYALKTLLRWEGFELVPSGADAVKPVRVPREPDKQTKP